MSFVLRTKTVTVTFDPRLVAADDVRRAVDQANAAMSAAPKRETDLRNP